MKSNSHASSICPSVPAHQEETLEAGLMQIPMATQSAFTEREHELSWPVPDRVFEDVSAPPDAFLTLDFRPIRQPAGLNAIELIPNESPRAPALIKNHRAKKRLYRPFGPTLESALAISLTGCRFRRASTGLRLLFAETFFGRDNPGKSASGAASLTSIAAAPLHRVDIFKEAGKTVPSRRSSTESNQTFMAESICPSNRWSITRPFSPLTWSRRAVSPACNHGYR
jgi:hypothetical protein